MRGTTVSTYITLEIEVEVEGTYYSGSPASTLGSPDNWESEDPGQIEISVIRAVNPDPHFRNKEGYQEVPLRLMKVIDKSFENDAMDALCAQAEEDMKEAKAEAEHSAYEARMRD